MVESSAVVTVEVSGSVSDKTEVAEAVGSSEAAEPCEVELVLAMSEEIVEDTTSDSEECEDVCS
jgi:hypothetical protein